MPIDEGPTSTRAVSGFSSLPKLMKMSPKSYEKFLELILRARVEHARSFGMEDDLEGVLEALKRRKLGIAIVNGMVDGEVRFSLITMDDLLGLYQTRQFTSDLTVEDVSSPIFSLPAKTTVRKALTTMFRLSHRTVFISGERTYVSDRTIIDRVFDPTLLEPFHGGPMESVFEARIGSLDRTTPVEVGFVDEPQDRGGSGEERVGQLPGDPEQGGPGDTMGSRDEALGERESVHAGPPL